MCMQACNLSTLEMKAEGSGVCGQPRLYETLSLNKGKEEMTKEMGQLVKHLLYMCEDLNLDLAKSLLCCCRETP